MNCVNLVDHYDYYTASFYAHIFQQYVMIIAFMEHVSVQMCADVTRDLRAQDATKVCWQKFSCVQCLLKNTHFFFFFFLFKLYWLNTNLYGLLPVFICISSARKNKLNKTNPELLSAFHSFLHSKIPSPYILPNELLPEYTRCEKYPNTEFSMFHVFSYSDYISVAPAVKYPYSVQIHRNKE